MLEIAKRIAVEQDKNGNHFCIAHSSLSIASFRGVGRGIWKWKCLLVQFQLIFFAEIICNTIHFRNFADKFHRGLFYRYLFGYQQQIYEKQSSFWTFVETILRQKQVLLIPNWGYYLQHSLSVDTQKRSEMLPKILGDFPKKHGDFSENVWEISTKVGDFLRKMGAFKCPSKWIRISQTKQRRICTRREKDLRKGRKRICASGEKPKCLLFQLHTVLGLGRVLGLSRLRFFGSSRDIACREEIAVDQRMTAKRSWSLLDDGQ